MEQKKDKQKKAGENGISRRDFLKLAGAGLAAVTVLPSGVLGQKASKKAGGIISPSDKLNVAGIGIGGRGGKVIEGMADQNIVALCDVDWAYAGKTFSNYPGAKKFKDYRKMFDQMGSSIDAIVVGTADHTHALIASEGLVRGKHVYCEKPLTHSVYESRLLTKLAAKYKVATQMGNQGASGDGVRKMCNWIWGGAIGEVTRVDAFTNRPIWPQGLTRPALADPIPNTLDWDLFLGPAPFRPYNKVYTPWNWRGWWDFGTGALGDMACHILHPVFKGLKLGYPTKLQGSSTPLMTESPPNAQIVRLTFPARDNMPRVAMPEVVVTWYDGGLQPPRPAGLPDGVNLDMGGGGVIFYGTKDTMICGCYGANPYLLSGNIPNVPEDAPEAPETGHIKDFIRAAKESAGNRVLTKSDFSEAGPFNEMVVIGVLAIRLQSLNKILEWDGPNMRFTNIGPEETIKIMLKNDFTIEEGHPHFDKKFTDPINALEFANGLIKHNYREGWKLPDMPE